MKGGKKLKNRKNNDKKVRPKQLKRNKTRNNQRKKLLQKQKNEETERFNSWLKCQEQRIAQLQEYQGLIIEILRCENERIRNQFLYSLSQMAIPIPEGYSERRDYRRPL